MRTKLINRFVVAPPTTTDGHHLCIQSRPSAIRTVPVERIQGGSCASEQEIPAAVMLVAQHWEESTPGIVPHPSPPQKLPHARGQHTSVFGSWTPVIPLSHVESFDAAAADRPTGHRHCGHKSKAAEEVRRSQAPKRTTCTVDTRFV